MVCQAKQLRGYKLRQLFAERKLYGNTGLKSGALVCLHFFGLQASVTRMLSGLPVFCEAVQAHHEMSALSHAFTGNRWIMCDKRITVINVHMH